MPIEWLIENRWLEHSVEKDPEVACGLGRRGPWSECWPYEWSEWKAQTVFSICHPRTHRIKFKLTIMAYKMCTPYCILHSGIAHRIRYLQFTWCAILFHISESLLTQLPSSEIIYFSSQYHSLRENLLIFQVWTQRLLISLGPK